MPTIHATVDNRIRVRVGDMPDEADDAVIEALCIPNLERENAKKQHQYGWEEMPEIIPMYGLSGGRDENAILDMPRGFAHDFADGMEALGYHVEFDDHRSKPTKFRIGKKIELRDHQHDPIEDILENEQGIYKAPPGSGKTVTVLRAGKLAGTKCLIIVNTKDILRQWVNRIHEHLGDHIDVGEIGDNKFDIGYIWTVATAQTIHSRYDELEAEGFFEEFGFVCLDECHHATADTYNKIMDRFTAKFRFGVSATPDKTGDFQLAQLVLGPLIHVTKHAELADAGFLINPTIIRVKTDFSYNFRGNTSKHSKTNYPEMIQALITDRRRNQSIVNAIMAESGHHCLVLTKRHEHIDLLEAMLWEARYEYPILRLTGKEKSSEREEVVKTIERWPCCVISTVADEALDVPRIDRLFLPFPQKNIGLIEQQLGRSVRAHPDKEDCLVYDWADVEVGPLRKQWRVRFMHVYKARKFTIIRTNMEDYLHA